MKIGIITFHYATNYGAVLQAYALQKFISNLGIDCKIIDYHPFRYRKSLLRCFLSRRPIRIYTNLYDLIKDRIIETFRKKHLVLTPKYASLAELQADSPESDMYVCGSDQIWNLNFTARGEGGLTTSYFLDFGPPQMKRVSYAASFGCTEYPDNLKSHVTKALKKFNAISVREQSGLDILKDMGLHNAELMPDPTILLERTDYEELLSERSHSCEDFVFVYALHKKQMLLQNLCTTLKQSKEKIIYAGHLAPLSILSIEDWLFNIASSKSVVTNSFHGVVFSILFHTPFIAVPVEGNNFGMNDRLTTLLDDLDLKERILTHASNNNVSKLLSKPIDWHHVDSKINRQRARANSFFSKLIEAHIPA